MAEQKKTGSGTGRSRSASSQGNKNTQHQGRRPSQQAKKSSQQQPKPQETEQKPVNKAPEQKNENNQFWSVVLFAAGVLVLLMAVIEGTAGWNRIHNMLIGLFGAAVFIVPVIFIYTAVLIGMEKSQRCVSGRAVWCVALTFLMSSLIQIFFVGDIPGKNVFGKIAELYRDGKSFEGGGVASIIIAGPLFALFGKTGAKIIVILLFFVFGMLLTNTGLIQFFQLLTRPFRFIGKCFSGMVNVFNGGEFDDAFEDDEEEEERDFQAACEAINMVNNRRTSDKSADSDEPEFLFDIPLPSDKNASYSNGKSTKTRTKKTDKEVYLDENGNPQPPVDSIDALISQANDNFQKNAYSGDAYGSSADEEEAKPEYMLPSLELLTLPDNKSNSEEAATEMREKAETIVSALKSFGVTVRMSNIYRGPSITRYEIQPGAGVKVSRIKGLEDDIALYLAAQGIRIEAPVPGKAAVGIEVPNTQKDMVTLREILSSNEFRKSDSKLAFAVGKDIAGNNIIGDVAKMPHVIIAGTTGSGKSVCTRSIIMSILYNAKPDEVKLILIDPKIVEFRIFEGIPHLLIPIVTDSKKALGALNWAVNEMERRYQRLADAGANDIASYNEIAENNEDLEKMPQIVIFIDELADMMLVAGKEVEQSILRLAQKARAAGIHLVVATQRPTTDVITGLIKANIPSRIALSVMSQVDSRTIIDQAGADKLLGNGDMLYMPIGFNKPVRVQGCFASTKEISSTVRFIKEQMQSEYDSDIMNAVESFELNSKDDKDDNSDSLCASGSDEDFIERAMAVAVENGQLSTSMLQRKLKLGYARAARIMDELEEMGIIGPSEGAKPRRVLMSRMQYDERKLRRME